MQPLIQQHLRLGRLAAAHQGHQQGIFDDFALGTTATDPRDVRAHRLQQPSAVLVILVGEGQQAG